MTSTWEEFGEKDKTTNTPTVTISSDLRRTILGQATPYRNSDAMATHHVVGSANFKVNDGPQVELRVHPLCEMKEKDRRWLEAQAGMHCFHCCHMFEDVPVWIPQSLDNRGIYWVRPTPFCSLSCAKAHLVEKNPFDCSQQLMLLHKVARDVYGHTKEQIVAAPARQCLRIFMGDMTIEEFRKEHQYARVSIATPPFTPLNMFIERSPHIGPVNAMAQAATDLTMPSNSSWSTHDLRRPSVPQMLPRATIENPGPSMLQQFVETKRSDNTWDSSRINAPRVVTSQTPSVQQVNDARNATLQKRDLASHAALHLRGRSQQLPTKQSHKASNLEANQSKAAPSRGDIMRFVNHAAE